MDDDQLTLTEDRSTNPRTRLLAMLDEEFNLDGLKHNSDFMLVVVALESLLDMIESKADEHHGHTVN